MGPTLSRAKGLQSAQNIGRRVAEIRRFFFVYYSLVVDVVFFSSSSSAVVEDSFLADARGGHPVVALFCIWDDR